MIPEATETIASAAQSTGSSPSIWTSVILTILGGLLAAAAGFGVAEYQRRQEKKERSEEKREEQKEKHQWIAFGLLTDIERAKEILDKIPVDSPEHALAPFVEFSRRDNRRYTNIGMLYPRNGLYSTHFADIINLGSFARDLVPLYQYLDQIEVFSEYVRSVPYDVSDPFVEGGQGSIYHMIAKAKTKIDVILPRLEKIAREKPKE